MKSQHELAYQVSVDFTFQFIIRLMFRNAQKYLRDDRVVSAVGTLRAGLH